MTDISIIKGDITTAKEDAIVNAANSRMLGGGGVDGAIHRAAGPQLLEECYKVQSVNGVRCPTGEARITLAGKLTARYVIHTVGPVYSSDPAPKENLTKAYVSSLNLAVENGCNSVAFPAISCGVYGYPVEEAAYIALKACLAPKYAELKIVFYLYNDAFVKIWQQTLESVLL